MEHVVYPWPGWILLGAAVGAPGSLIGVFVNSWLTSRRELRRFRIDSFERYRNEFFKDESLRQIREKEEPETEEEIEDLVGFYDEIGLYAHRGLIDMELLDEILGDYILDAYHSVRVMQHVVKVRMDMKDKSYYVYFEELAKQLEEKARLRKGE